MGYARYTPFKNCIHTMKFCVSWNDLQVSKLFTILNVIPLLMCIILEIRMYDMPSFLKFSIYFRKAIGICFRFAIVKISIFNSHTRMRS